MFNTKHLIRCAFTTLLATVPFLAGCGGSSGTRGVDVSGTVIFNGIPVPRGVIYFDPDTAANNDGVQGFARIRDGAYDTRETSKGIGGGPYRVRITGATAEGDGPAKALFGEYSVSVDFPFETTTRDFEVPASVARGLTDANRETP
jgi:hypothetical protein